MSCHAKPIFHGVHGTLRLVARCYTLDGRDHTPNTAKGFDVSRARINNSTPRTISARMNE